MIAVKVVNQSMPKRKRKDGDAETSQLTQTQDRRQSQEKVGKKIGKRPMNKKHKVNEKEKETKVKENKRQNEKDDENEKNDNLLKMQYPRDYDEKSVKKQQNIIRSLKKLVFAYFFNQHTSLKTQKQHIITKDTLPLAKELLLCLRTMGYVYWFFTGDVNHPAYEWTGNQLTPVLTEKLFIKDTKISKPFWPLLAQRSLQHLENPARVMLITSVPYNVKEVRALAEVHKIRLFIKASVCYKMIRHLLIYDEIHLICWSLNHVYINEWDKTDPNGDDTFAFNILELFLWKLSYILHLDKAVIDNALFVLKHFFSIITLKESILGLYDPLKAHEDHTIHEFTRPTTNKLWYPIIYNSLFKVHFNVSTRMKTILLSECLFLALDVIPIVMDYALVPP